MTSLGHKDNVKQKNFGFGEDLKFITFLGLSDGAVESRIAFLAQEEDLIMVIIKHDQSFIKESDGDLTNWSI